MGRAIRNRAIVQLVYVCKPRAGDSLTFGHSACVLKLSLILSIRMILMLTCIHHYIIVQLLEPVYQHKCYYNYHYMGISNLSVLDHF